jgi:NADH-quinone oxidoreductase subunit H
MTEYSGFRWALYFLAEYGNMVVVSAVAVTLFWGGWLRPFPNVAFSEIPCNYVFPVALFAGSGLASFALVKRQPTGLRQGFLAVVALSLILVALLFAIPVINRAIIGLFWFFLKVAVFLYVMIWIRGTFPRFRYDQLMNIGWKILIPLGMALVLINAVLGMVKA